MKCSEYICNPYSGPGACEEGPTTTAFPDKRGGLTFCRGNPWACMVNLGVRKNATVVYRQPKKETGRGVFAKREQMPRCVIDHLPDLYLNIANVRHLGHQWD